jgi:hypothetical protein
VFHPPSSIYTSTMDFVERVFGSSPDGGSGMFEALILCSVMGALALMARKKLLGISDGTLLRRGGPHAIGEYGPDPPLAAS